MLDREAVITVVAGQLRVNFDYDERVIAALKTLPRRTRRWDPSLACWVVDGAFLADVTRILKAADYTVTVIGQERQPPPRASSPKSSPIHPKRLTRDCLTELFAAYKADPVRLVRTLSFGFHPDHGGDVELQRWVNEINNQRPQKRGSDGDQ